MFLAQSPIEIPVFRNQVLEKTSPYFLVGAQDQRLVAEQNQLPCGSTGTSSATVERQKLAWFGHVTLHDSLSSTILQGTLEGERRLGRQRKYWTDNIKE